MRSQSAASVQADSHTYGEEGHAWDLEDAHRTCRKEEGGGSRLALDVGVVVELPCRRALKEEGLDMVVKTGEATLSISKGIDQGQRVHRMRLSYPIIQCLLCDWICAPLLLRLPLWRRILSRGVWIA